MLKAGLLLDLILRQIPGDIIPFQPFQHIQQVQPLWLLIPQRQRPIYCDYLIVFKQHQNPRSCVCTWGL